MGQKKAIEIPNLAILGPLIDKCQGLRDPLEKGYIQKKPLIDDLLTPILAVISDEFIDLAQGKLSIDTTSEKAVGRYNRHDKIEVQEVFNGQITHLSLPSIARVALTDTQTVELVLQEINATLAELAKKNKSVKLNLKVGFLLIKNEQVQWQQSRELMGRLVHKTGRNGSLTGS